MKPLHQLTAKDKAKLLFELFPTEAADFVPHLKTLAIETLDDRQEIQRVWGNQMIESGYWLELATCLKKQLDEHGDAVYFSKSRFVKALFKDRVLVFTLYALNAYSETKACPPAFSQAIWLLFTLNNIDHEIFNEFRQYRKSETFA